MNGRNLVGATLLAAVLAAGTWGAIAIAQPPPPDDADARDTEARAFDEAMGPGPGAPHAAMSRGAGMGMGMGHGPGMGMGHGPGMGPGAGGPRGPMAHLRQLGLTAQQREKIEAIHDAERRGAIEIRKDLELAQLDMQRLMKADTPDRRAIDAQIDRVAELRTRLHKARVNAMLDVRGVLTPQQREKLEQLREGGDDQAPGPRAPGMRGPERQGGTRSR